MNLRQKAKKLKKENEILKKIRIIPMKPTIKVLNDSYETLRNARLMTYDELPIEEYKHQIALDIGIYLYKNNFIDWEITSDNNPYKTKKLIGTIKVVRGDL